MLVQDTGWNGYEGVPQWIVEGYSTLFAETDRQLRDAGARLAGLVVVPVGVGSLAQAAVSTMSQPADTAGPRRCWASSRTPPRVSSPASPPGGCGRCRPGRRSWRGSTAQRRPAWPGRTCARAWTRHRGRRRRRGPPCRRPGRARDLLGPERSGHLGRRARGADWPRGRGAPRRPRRRRRFGGGAGQHRGRRAAILRADPAMSTVRSDVIDLLKQLVAIDSVNPSLVPAPPGSARSPSTSAAGRPRRACRSSCLGGDAWPAQRHVRSGRNGGGRTLLLCAHLDTVGLGG